MEGGEESVGALCEWGFADAAALSEQHTLENDIQFTQNNADGAAAKRSKNRSSSGTRKSKDSENIGHLPGLSASALSKEHQQVSPRAPKSNHLPYI